MLKTMTKCIREYKTPTILTILFIIGEVVIEVIIPFITADLINAINKGVVMSEILKTGALLLVMALVSLACGGLAGFTCAKASAGFAKNVRHDIFKRVQTFAFKNIDKFSTSSLVTRMTTDINNVQMSFMMLIRMAIRAPFMLVFAIIMAYIMGGALASCFVVVIPVLVFGLLMVSRSAMPAFRRVFKKYDKLNESIEENVRAMRVVKGFSREEYEKQKFAAASESIRKDFTRAERLVALNTPLADMRLLQYGVRAADRLKDNNIQQGRNYRCRSDTGNADLRYADTHAAYDAVYDIRYAHHVGGVDKAYLRGAE